jgi:hypothetical protein
MNAKKEFKQKIYNLNNKVKFIEHQNLPETDLRGFYAVLDMFTLSRCKCILQNVKYSTFSICAAIIGGIKLLNFSHILDKYETFLCHLWNPFFKEDCFNEALQVCTGWHEAYIY